MNLRKTLITALILCTVITSAIIYTLAKQNQNDLDVEEIAIEFLVNGPTFSFDGIKESIQIIETYSMESYPIQNVVVIAFSTSHAGWGNREGTFVAQVITPHVIKITLVEGKIVAAIIDEKWDEVNQAQIIPDDLLIMEDARDKAIHYIVKNYPELGVEVPGEWVSEMYTQSGMVGSSTVKYLGDGWDISMRYQVVQYPDYEVEICYAGDKVFTWSGTVHSTGAVTENSMQR